MADFIWADQRELIITTNKVVSMLDFNTIKKYIKNVDVVDFKDVIAPWLPQSRSYLKIFGILYIIENTNTSVSSGIIEQILQSTHIFNNMVLASKLRVIKVSPKLDMAVIWIDIWDVQSSSKAKSLINRYFNIGNYITTIQGTNIKPRILQCKNCWKWGHTMFFYHAHGSKYIKCNGPHKIKHYCDLVWCCKANFKTNYQDLKPREINYPCIASSALITKVNTKLIVICVCSEGTGSTKSDMPKSIKSFVKTETNRSTQLWVR